MCVITDLSVTMNKSMYDDQLRFAVGELIEYIVHFDGGEKSSWRQPLACGLWSLM